MVELVSSWKHILDRLSAERQDLDIESHKFKLLLVAEAEKHSLSVAEVNEMMLSFGHVVSRRPKNVPETWRLTWCKNYLSQKTEYVSHTEIVDNKPCYATWNKQKSLKGFDRTMKQEDTHIPWEIYDFNNFNLDMPVCKCRK